MLSRCKSKMNLMKIFTFQSPISVRFASSYQDAVRALNQLQTPSEVLKEIEKSGGRDDSLQFQKSQQYTRLAGLEDEHLNSLNAIHISGTKGKGSTGAFCESILRHCGLKTGFFSSPHLIEVRERIRINGSSLTQDKFASYFDHCFNVLNDKKDTMNGELPGYFRFITIMALYAFLEEKVDVAIVEVGMGGEYDPTNVIKRPTVCGITSLDFDHTKQLGARLGEIAWHKSGIFKAGRPAYTVPQEREAMQVIRERSSQIRVASLNIVPQWHEYPIQLIGADVAGGHQKLNASLALQLCRRWLIEKDRWTNFSGASTSTRPSQGVSKFGDKLPTPFKDGIEKCRWPGRHQVVYMDHVTYYLDGAHTVKSIDTTSDWFKTTSSEETTKLSGQVSRALIFNMTGDRDFHDILNTLKGCEFNCALFCPNIMSTNKTGDSWIDMTNYTVNPEEQFAKCKSFEQYWKDTTPSGETAALPSVEDAVQWLNDYRERSPELHLQVLVCGSLHLVGAVMATLKAIVKKPAPPIAGVLLLFTILPQNISVNSPSNELNEALLSGIQT